MVIEATPLAILLHADLLLVKHLDNPECYKYDSTLTVSRSNPEELDQVIDVKYKGVERYMMANKMILNSYKTHLLIMATSYQHKHHQDFGLTLITED